MAEARRAVRSRWAAKAGVSRALQPAEDLRSAEPASRPVGRQLTVARSRALWGEGSSARSAQKRAEPGAAERAAREAAAPGSARRAVPAEPFRPVARLPRPARSPHRGPRSPARCPPPEPVDPCGGAGRSRRHGHARKWPAGSRLSTPSGRTRRVREAGNIRPCRVQTIQIRARQRGLAGRPPATSRPCPG